MRRRRLRWMLTLAGLAVVVAVGVVVLWPRADLVTLENFQRLRCGMTEAEVEAILGPSGDHTSGDTEPDLEHQKWQYLTPPESYGRQEALKGWIADRACIGVGFDSAGNVGSAFCIPMRNIDHGPIGNLLWLAKRQWHCWFPEK
jgi:hypothetical protein